jgi:hypothetical protein
VRRKEGENDFLSIRTQLNYVILFRKTGLLNRPAKAILEAGGSI